MMVLAPEVATASQGGCGSSRGPSDRVYELRDAVGAPTTTVRASSCGDGEREVASS